MVAGGRMTVALGVSWHRDEDRNKFVGFLPERLDLRNANRAVVSQVSGLRFRVSPAAITPSTASATAAGTMSRIQIGRS